MNIIVFLFV